MLKTYDSKNKGADCDVTNIEKKCLIFISRTQMLNDMLFYAGTLDKDDIWSQEYESPDWQLIRQNTIEFQADDTKALLMRYAEREAETRAKAIPVMRAAGKLPSSIEELTQEVENIEGNNTQYQQGLALNQLGQNPLSFLQIISY